MQKIQIVTTSVASSTIKKLVVRSGKVRWVYLARDYRLMRRLVQELGNDYVPISIADVLNTVADELRTEHIEWIDTLNRANGGRLCWWFGAVSSRSVYSSNLFLYSCYLIALQRLWQKQETRPDLIIADSSGLAECIGIWLQAQNAEMKNRSSSFLRKLKASIRLPLQVTRFGAVLGARYFASLISKFGATLQVKNGPWVIVDTFIHDQSLTKKGVFTDRYYPYLHEYLASKGHRVLVHPVFYGFRCNFNSIFSRLRKSKTSFIIQEDYLRFSDYAAAFLNAVALLRMQLDQCPFKGIDLAPVIQEEQRSQSFVPVMQSILEYRLWRRLRQAGIELSWVINWFENQPIHRALIAGVRAAYPGKKILGEQMFIHIPNYLRSYPSLSEFEAGMTPDILLQTGGAQCGTAVKYAPAVPCRAAAALRFAHLFSGPAARSESISKDAILVLLPSFMDETLEILDMLLNALQELPAGIECLIKCHPDYNSPEEIIKAFGRDQWPKEFRIWDGSLTGAFERAATVISSNSSSMVEASVLGIPVVLIVRQSNLTMNPLAEIPSATFTTCYNSAQLTRAITRYRSLSQYEHDVLTRNGLMLRDRYFTAINDATLSVFEISERTLCN